MNKQFNSTSWSLIWAHKPIHNNQARRIICFTYIRNREATRQLKWLINIGFATWPHTQDSCYLYKLLPFLKLMPYAHFNLGPENREREVKGGGENRKLSLIYVLVFLAISRFFLRFPFSLWPPLTSFWELCTSILLQLNFHAIWAFRTATGTTTRTRAHTTRRYFQFPLHRSTERNAIFNTISLCRANNRLRVCHCVSTWHRKRWRLKTTGQTPSKAGFPCPLPPIATHYHPFPPIPDQFHPTQNPTTRHIDPENPSPHSPTDSSSQNSLLLRFKHFWVISELCLRNRDRRWRSVRARPAFKY